MLPWYIEKSKVSLKNINKSYALSNRGRESFQFEKRHRGQLPFE